ncbi:hypothetical protein PYCCODRAFT_1430119 [Trametes coccinea BRFM310]|uniref:DUF6533 domain-containing protein n=1 Tax=Trametes coccinea (strain BRFM310) TaxID=1353009 RepID=A0A1Y2J3I0_TRAC3|nr:hypothetical protein PYCCODRAFT_1430119 [Trametes coccinea BRFM310]
MALNPFAEALLLEALPTIEKTRYAELASTVIILFDHIITLDQEINLIWRSQFSLGKVLFLVNRYYALCVVLFNNYALFNTNNLTDSFCLSWFKWQGWTGVITFVIAELILQLRLYALYFRDKRILALMATVCLGAAASSAYVMAHALSHISSVAVKLPHTGSTVCMPSGLPGNFFALWIPMLVSESVLCGLALYRGFKSFMPGSNVFQNGKRIIEILVRDSLSYFVIIFATYLVNAILFVTRPDSEVEIPIGFAVALSVVMSNRLCLNVRGYIRTEIATLSLTSLPPRPPGSAALVSFDGYASRLAYSSGHADDEEEWSDGLGGYGEYEDVQERSLGSTGQKTVEVAQGGVLNELEMRELRAMRAQSPKHLRTL